MKSIQEDFLTMLYVLKACLDVNKPVWTANTVFNVDVVELNDKITKIEKAQQAQSLNSTSLTEEQNKRFEDLLQSVLFILNRIESFSLVKGNKNLAATIKYSETSLRRSRFTTFNTNAANIINVATINLTALTPYSISQPLLTDAQTLLTNYKNSMPTSKQAKAKEKNATKSLDTLFNEVKTIIKRLDLDIDVFKKSNPDFYNQYQTSRLVKETGSNNHTIILQTVNALTDKPEEGVKLSVKIYDVEDNKIINADKPIEVNRKSPTSGTNRITGNGDKRVIITAEKLGFNKEVHEYNIHQGETLRIKLSMTKYKA